MYFKEMIMAFFVGFATYTSIKDNTKYYEEGLLTFLGIPYISICKVPDHQLKCEVDFIAAVKNTNLANNVEALAQSEEFQKMKLIFNNKFGTGVDDTYCICMFGKSHRYSKVIKGNKVNKSYEFYYEEINQIINLRQIREMWFSVLDESDSVEFLLQIMKLDKFRLLVTQLISSDEFQNLAKELEKLGFPIDRLIRQTYAELLWRLPKKY